MLLIMNATHNNLMVKENDSCAGISPFEKLKCIDLFKSHFLYFPHLRGPKESYFYLLNTKAESNFNF